MFIYEVELPNGFTVQIDNEIENNKVAKKVELHENSIVFYYDELTKKELCSNMEIIRDEKVTDIQPSVIRAYEYYRPERIHLSNYELSKEVSKMSVCQVCGQDCEKCAKLVDTEEDKGPVVIDNEIKDEKSSASGVTMQRLVVIIIIILIVLMMLIAH